MTKNRKVYELTKEGLENLRKELRYLKDEQRPYAIGLLQDAKKLGDLSENADYDAARDLQAKVESRIKEIERIIENAKIIEVSNETNKVTFGKTVKLLLVEKNKEVKYRLVGTVETNPSEKKISVDSPVGKAIVGKERGDTALVQLENGRNFHVKVLEITNEQ